MSGIQRVLQLLLAERISIRDLSTILEGIADALAFSRNPATMVEHVRARLARQICAQNTSHNGYLPLIALSARWEQAFAESIVGQGEERSLAMQPSKLSEFMTAVRDALRAGRPRRRGAGAGDLGGDPPVRALAGRALPLADHGAVAGGNPPAGAAEDGRQRLDWAAQIGASPPSELFRHRQMVCRIRAGSPTPCTSRPVLNLISYCNYYIIS